MTQSNLEEDQSFPERMAENGFGSYDFRNNSMGNHEAYRLGKSLSDYYGKSSKVIIGRDHREKSEPVKNGLIEGLLDHGTHVRYVGLAPTDLIAHQVNSGNYDGGVAVTASHMPPGFRGLKPLNGKGRIFDETELNEVLEGYTEFKDTKDEYQNWQTDLETDRFGGKYEVADDIFEQYISDAVKRYEELFNQDLSGVSVAVDLGNGMGCLTVPRLLNELGVENNDLYLLNYNLDPDFNGRGADPTDSELDQLKQTVKEEDLDLGIAFDGDADRAVFINDNSEKVVGDESLAILSEKYLDSAETGHKAPGIVCSANTSQMVEDWLTQGISERESLGTVNYQPVGAVFTAKECLNNENMLFGGQPNGHLLDPEFVPYDSGTLAGAVMAGIINQTKSLSSKQDELPSYDIVRTNWEVDDKQDAMEILKTQFGGKNTHGVHRADITRENIVGLTGANDKVLFRPSGNEPVIRITVERRAETEMLDKLKNTTNQLLEQ